MKTKKAAKIVIHSLEPFKRKADVLFCEMYCRDCPDNDYMCFPCESSVSVVETIANELAAENAKWN